MVAPKEWNTIDIAAKPETFVEVRLQNNIVDKTKSTLYVDVDGVTVLRIGWINREAGKLIVKLEDGE